MDTIKIKIKGKEFNVKKSYRTLMLFEEISGKGIGDMKQNVSDLLLLLYCAFKANNKESFEYTYDEYIDLIDEYPEIIEQFNEYLITEAKKLIQPTTKKK